MRKIVILALCFLAISYSKSEATEITVEPRATIHFFEDLDNSIGIGAQAHLNNIKKGLFKEDDSIRASIGFEVLQAEGDIYRSFDFYKGRERKVRTVTMRQAIDPEIVITNLDVAYVHPITPQVDVYVGGGLDIWFIGNDGDVKIDNAVGGHIGGGAKYQANNYIDIVIGAQYQLAEADVTSGSIERSSTELDLDNVGLYGAVNIQF